MTPELNFNQSDAPSQGEFKMSQNDFERIAAILHSDSGIHLTTGKVALVYSRLAKRLRVLGLESFTDYCNLVTGKDGTDERRAMLNALTTNVTSFFRESHHFEHLTRHLENDIAPRARKGERIRLWSAGCSSGEEPYSMAAILLKVLPEAPRLDVKILATDIDRLVLERARIGRYPHQSLDHMAEEHKARLFTRDGAGNVNCVDAVRNMIAFNELNLMAASWPMKFRFDVIFCRNVAIYFEEAAQQRLWSRLATQLNPGGRLYVGHSERVLDERFVSDGLTVYKCKDDTP
ncbi:MAG: chemotaxis protein [Hirschia sp.]|nr:chemotaxis protein [Hirschia sp.]MBF18440.1 chemotaxis protein [Hirschia sp.]